MQEKLGPDALRLHLKPLWPEDKPHLPVAEIKDWFASYVYLPKLRDRVVLETAIRDEPAYFYRHLDEHAYSCRCGASLATFVPRRNTAD